MDKWLKLLGLDRSLLDMALMALASQVTSWRFRRATTEELKRNADEIRQFAEDRDWMLKSVRDEARELRDDVLQKAEEIKRLERACMTVTRQKVADAEYIRLMELLCRKAEIELPPRDSIAWGA